MGKMRQTHRSAAETTLASTAAVLQSTDVQRDASRTIELPADRAATTNKPIVIKIAPIQAAARSQSSAELGSDDEIVAMATANSETPKEAERVAVAELHSEVETAIDAGSGSTDAAKEPSAETDPAAKLAGDGAVELEVSPRPSREMKLLQQTHKKSKILTDIMSEASRKGKLRKRRSTSGGGGPAPSPDTGAHTGLRKRTRSRSAANPNPSADGAKELENDPGTDLKVLDDSGSLRTSSNRKIRFARSEYSLHKAKHTAGRSDRSISKDDDGTGGLGNDPGAFMSLANLNQEPDVVNDFPGDPPKPGWDRFCWRCKSKDPDLGCSKCIRSYHKLCVRYTVDNPNWSCTECKATTAGLRTDVDTFSQCLRYALDLVATRDENNTFNPFNVTDFEYYNKYISHHMDLSVIYERLAQRKYSAPEEFVSDLSWIVHNMLIYPGQLHLVKIARTMFKRGKQEMEEMEPCQECYIKANTKSDTNWFIEPCSKPHLLLWAKLKGYPYWPAKLYGTNANHQAHVRFFGDHDRAWLPVKDCYLYAKRNPNPQKVVMKSKQITFAKSIADIELHIEQLREKYNTFNYAEEFELLDPSNLDNQLRAMLPGVFVKKVKVTIKRNEGEMVAVASSTCEDTPSPSEGKESGGSELQVEKASPSAHKDAKPSKGASPRKRLTRRMSRIMKSPVESLEPVANTSKELMDESAASVALYNDTAANGTVASGKAVDNKRHRLNEDREELSLLIRRGSQSWETEPLSKRRKSIVDKSVLKAAGSKTAQPNKKVDAKLPKVSQQDSTVLPEAKPEGQPVPPVQGSANPEANAAATAVKSVPPPALTPTENVLTSLDLCRTSVTKHALVSIPADSTAAFVTQQEKDTSKTLATAGEACGAPASASGTPSTAPSSMLNSTSSTVSDISIKQEIISDDETLVKGDKIERSTTTEVKRKENEANVSIKSRVSSVNFPKSSEQEVSAVSLVPGKCVPNAGSNADDTAIATNSTKASLTQANAEIKTGHSNGAQKIVSSNPVPAPVPVNTTAKTNDVSTGAGAATMIGPSNQRASTLQASDANSSVAVSVGLKRHQAAVPATKTTKENGSANGDVVPVKASVGPIELPVSVVPKGNDSGAVTVVSSNQRARKSFPGGAANAKHAATARLPTPNANAAGSSIPNVSALRNSSLESLSIEHKSREEATVTKRSQNSNLSSPSATPIPSAASSFPPRVTEAPKRTASMNNTNPNANSNGVALVPKQLVPASTTISLIPSAADRISDKHMAPIDLDNDDIMIIDEDIPLAADQSSASSSQLELPPLVPRPQVQSPRTESTDREELVRPTDVLNDCAGQLLDSFRLSIENLLSDLADKGSPAAEVSLLKIKLDRSQKQHEQRTTELEAQRKIYEGMMQELRQSLEQEKKRALVEQREQLQRDKQRAVQSAKQKQWCKRCLKEAKFYCCWNTSYCEVSCQEKHWNEHKDVCNQAVEKRARSGLPMSMVPTVPDHCWAEDGKDRTPEHGGSVRPVLLLPVTTSVTISPDNNKGSMRKHAAAAATGTGPRGIGSPDNGGGRKKVTSSPSTASPGARGESNNINTTIPNSTMVPTATSTPFLAMARSYPSGGTSGANVSYTPPIIKAVYSIDSGASFPQHTAHNGSNLVSSGGVVSSMPQPQQQHQQRMNTSRDKSTKRSERRDNVASIKVSQGYVPTSTYDLTTSPSRITTVPVPSATGSMAMRAYSRIIPTGDVASMSVSQNVWNQISMQSATMRQSHLGNVGLGSGLSGQSAGDFRSMQHHTAATLPSQKQKPTREQ
uniref:Protein kinase C-binding protein 1 n=1 Tax=Anopheles melas TaxID=34690 RepID=A0A182TXC6_9DIPT